jgi:hypothetical protein
VPHAERRALGGSLDRGDIAGLPGVVCEAKSAARLELAAWLAEAEAERVNDGADIAVVWHKRRGKGSPADGYVTMTGATLVALLRAAGYIAETPGRPMGKLTVGDPREAAGPGPTSEVEPATRAATLAATKGS